MVIPGVYMIQRAPSASSLSSIVQSDGTINLELLHLEVDEMEKHIELLRKSNIEIAAYLRDKRKNGEEDEEGGGVGSMVALSNGTTEGEDDDAVFREALEENVLVIAKKERDLAQLKELIKGQRCGCCSAHSHPDAPQAEPSPPRQTRVTL
jgi:hypothetical protein